MVGQNWHQGSSVVVSRATPTTANGTTNGPAPGPAPDTRIIVTVDLTNLQADAFFPFMGGVQISAADLVGITTITYSWTGTSPAPGGGDFNIALAQDAANLANTQYDIEGTTTPQTSSDSNLWTGNEPYNGIHLINSIGPANLGIMTITLSP
ncbi:hypothetical protein ACFL2Q_07600 [Thermodesulfobacteriota bacterium]